LTGSVVTISASIPPAEILAKLGSASSLRVERLDTEFACRLPHLRNFLLRPNIGLAPQGSHHADFRDGLLQQGEPFRAVRPILKCDTRDVPARSRKARGKPGANGIAGEANDRNSRCRLLRRKTDRRAGGHQDIDFECKKLGDEGWNAIRVTIRVSRLDRYGLSDHISFVGEALGDPGEIARIRAARADPDISNPRYRHLLGQGAAGQGRA
jgi:hypothetical protein